MLEVRASLLQRPNLSDQFWNYWLPDWLLFLISALGLCSCVHRDTVLALSTSMVTAVPRAKGYGTSQTRYWRSGPWELEVRLGDSRVEFQGVMWLNMIKKAVLWLWVSTSPWLHEFLTPQKMWDQQGARVKPCEFRAQSWSSVFQVKV